MDLAWLCRYSMYNCDYFIWSIDLMFTFITPDTNGKGEGFDEIACRSWYFNATHQSTFSIQALTFFS